LKACPHPLLPGSNILFLACMADSNENIVI
jgi:hypothetical protein